MQPQKIFKGGRVRNSFSIVGKCSQNVMAIKTVLIIAIIINSVFSLSRENESEQLLVVNDDNLPSVNRDKRFCDGNVCSEAFREIPSSCMLASCTKRALQEDVGPFWANRGKRNPNYKTEPLYANEPHWILVRRANDEFLPYKYNYEPFFITRGKKDKKIEEDSHSIIQEMFAKLRIRNHQDSEIKNTE